jgi:nucleotide-binding universal stress UspA family protein
VAQITFGASVWLVVLTIGVVSAMYRLVMLWVTDGSGGSGLTEEEFGGWAVKINAAITFVEYTLTFLVSMAAMVTFIADRIPILNQKFLFWQYRTLIAILLSILTGWLVNRGPKVAARTFGPATGGVLLLLWAMVIASIFRFGLHLPDFNLQAFSLDNLSYTIRGYASILAVMTGIEVFANLVAAYEGDPGEKSKKAFNSLLMIMGTTIVTMLVVGPAILAVSDPTNESVSVFTQTMDVLLPAPLPWLGTLVGIAVLMSASAASAQGLQNLALGLKRRHYVPPIIGKQNTFRVADYPVWIEVGIVSFCFLVFGTHEETYLAIYAAGVFILLSMTGWAVAKRLIRQFRAAFSIGLILMFLGTCITAILTTGATLIIFFERFLEGAWTYFLFIPALFAVFGYFRDRLGEPSPEMEYLGQIDSTRLGGFGFGQSAVPTIREILAPQPEQIVWHPAPKKVDRWKQEQVVLERIAVLLDGSANAAQALPMAKKVCQAADAEMVLLSSIKAVNDPDYETIFSGREAYLNQQCDELEQQGYRVSAIVRPGHIADATSALVKEQRIDMIVTSTSGKSGTKHWQRGGVSRKLMALLNIPVLLVKVSERDILMPSIQRVVVSLDGSEFSERVLPYARVFAELFDCELVLLSVPQVPEVKDYRAAAGVIDTIRAKALGNMQTYLKGIADSLMDNNGQLKVRVLATGSLPSRTIISVSEEENADLIMLTSQGRGGLDLLMTGSVALQVVEDTDLPVFMIPIID